MPNNILKISMKAARVNADLTQYEAAKALKISKATIQNYENGKTIPDWETVEEMERLYGISKDNIIFLPLNIAKSE